MKLTPTMLEVLRKMAAKLKRQSMDEVLRRQAERRRGIRPAPRTETRE